MARYKKSDGYCVNHPEVEAVDNRNYCLECWRKRQDELRLKRAENNKKYYKKYASKGLPPKEDLEKFAQKKYDTKSLSITYQVSPATILGWYRCYDLEPYKKTTKNHIETLGELMKEFAGVTKGSSVFVNDIFFNVRPKHL